MAQQPQQGDHGPQEDHGPPGHDHLHVSAAQSAGPHDLAPPLKTETPGPAWSAVDGAGNLLVASASALSLFPPKEKAFDFDARKTRCSSLTVLSDKFDAVAESDHLISLRPHTLLLGDASQALLHSDAYWYKDFRSAATGNVPDAFARTEDPAVRALAGKRKGAGFSASLSSVAVAPEQFVSSGAASSSTGEKYQQGEGALTSSPTSGPMDSAGGALRLDLGDRLLCLSESDPKKLFFVDYQHIGDAEYQARNPGAPETGASLKVEHVLECEREVASEQASHTDSLLDALHGEEEQGIAYYVVTVYDLVGIAIRKANNNGYRYQELTPQHQLHGTNTTPAKEEAIAFPNKLWAKVEGTLTTFACDSAGKQLASADSRSHNIRVWDCSQILFQHPQNSNKPAILHVLHGHTDVVQDLTFDTQLKTLLSASRDKSVRQWVGGCCVRVLEGVGGSVSNSLLLEASYLFLSATDSSSRADEKVGSKRGFVAVWHRESLEKLHQLEPPLVEKEITDHTGSLLTANHSGTFGKMSHHLLSKLHVTKAHAPSLASLVVTPTSVLSLSADTSMAFSWARHVTGRAPARYLAKQKYENIGGQRNRVLRFFDPPGAVFSSGVLLSAGGGGGLASSSSNGVGYYSAESVFAWGMQESGCRLEAALSSQETTKAPSDPSSTTSEQSLRSLDATVVFLDVVPGSVCRQAKLSSRSGRPQLQQSINEEPGHQSIMAIEYGIRCVTKGGALCLWFGPKFSRRESEHHRILAREALSPVVVLSVAEVPTASAETAGRLLAVLARTSEMNTGEKRFSSVVAKTFGRRNNSANIKSAHSTSSRETLVLIVDGVLGTVKRCVPLPHAFLHFAVAKSDLVLGGAPADQTISDNSCTLQVWNDFFPKITELDLHEDLHEGVGGGAVEPIIPGGASNQTESDALVALLGIDSTPKTLQKIMRNDHAENREKTTSLENRVRPGYGGTRPAASAFLAASKSCVTLYRRLPGGGADHAENREKTTSKLSAPPPPAATPVVQKGDHKKKKRSKKDDSSDSRGSASESSIAVEGSHSRSQPPSFPGAAPAPASTNTSKYEAALNLKTALDATGISAVTVGGLDSGAVWTVFGGFASGQIAVWKVAAGNKGRTGRTSLLYGDGGASGLRVSLTAELAMLILPPANDVFQTMSLPADQHGHKEVAAAKNNIKEHKTELLGDRLLHVVTALQHKAVAALEFDEGKNLLAVSDFAGDIRLVEATSGVVVNHRLDGFSDRSRNVVKSAVSRRLFHVGRSGRDGGDGAEVSDNYSYPDERPDCIYVREAGGGGSQYTSTKTSPSAASLPPPLAVYVFGADDITPAATPVEIYYLQTVYIDREHPWFDPHLAHDQREKFDALNVGVGGGGGGGASSVEVMTSPEAVTASSAQITMASGEVSSGEELDNNLLVQELVVAAATDGTLTVYRGETGQELRRFPGHFNVVGVVPMWECTEAQAVIVNGGADRKQAAAPMNGKSSAVNENVNGIAASTFWVLSLACDEHPAGSCTMHSESGKFRFLHVRDANYTRHPNFNAARKTFADHVEATGTHRSWMLGEGITRARIEDGEPETPSSKPPRGSFEQSFRARAKFLVFEEGSGNKLVRGFERFYEERLCGDDLLGEYFAAGRGGPLLSPLMPFEISIDADANVEAGMFGGEKSPQVFSLESSAFTSLLSLALLNDARHTREKTVSQVLAHIAIKEGINLLSWAFFWWWESGRSCGKTITGTLKDDWFVHVLSACALRYPDSVEQFVGKLPFKTTEESVTLLGRADSPSGWRVWQTWVDAKKRASNRNLKRKGAGLFGRMKWFFTGDKEAVYKAQVDEDLMKELFDTSEERGHSSSTSSEGNNKSLLERFLHATTNEARADSIRREAGKLHQSGETHFLEANAVVMPYPGFAQVFAHDPFEELLHRNEERNTTSNVAIASKKSSISQSISQLSLADLPSVILKFLANAVYFFLEFFAILFERRAGLAVFAKLKAQVMNRQQDINGQHTSFLQSLVQMASVPGRKEMNFFNNLFVKALIRFKWNAFAAERVRREFRSILLLLLLHVLFVVSMHRGIAVNAERDLLIQEGYRTMENAPPNEHRLATGLDLVKLSSSSPSLKNNSPDDESWSVEVVAGYGFDFAEMSTWVLFLLIPIQVYAFILHLVSFGDVLWLQTIFHLRALSYQNSKLLGTNLQTTTSYDLISYVVLFSSLFLLRQVFAVLYYLQLTSAFFGKWVRILVEMAKEVLPLMLLWGVGV
eukprot:g12896.t1